MAYFDANGTDSQGRPFQYWLGDSPPALRAFGQMLSWRRVPPRPRDEPVTMQAERADQDRAGYLRDDLPSCSGRIPRARDADQRVRPPARAA